MDSFRQHCFRGKDNISYVSNKQFLYCEILKITLMTFFYIMEKNTEAVTAFPYQFIKQYYRGKGKNIIMFD